MLHVCVLALSVLVCGWYCRRSIHILLFLYNKQDRADAARDIRFALVWWVVLFAYGQMFFHEHDALVTLREAARMQQCCSLAH